MVTTSEDLPAPRDLLRQVDALVEAVHEEAAVRRARWPAVRPEFEDSAANLAAWLALRQHDLRPLQCALRLLGLSSLGRLESRVLAGLQATRASLATLAGVDPGPRPSAAAFFDGEQRLARGTEALIGTRHAAHSACLLVTCPTEAADDPNFMIGLARRGVEAILVDCAHDDAATWQRMIANARAAQQETGRRLRVFMELAGQRIRTGRLAVPDAEHRLKIGDRVAIVVPGALDAVPAEMNVAAAECALAEAVQAARRGDLVFYDDGKFAAVVEQVEAWGVVARIRSCADKGVKLKREKGLDFPDTDFRVDGPTDKDLQDLDFVARNADAVAVSFVQSTADVIRLQRALATRREDWQQLGLVLKIETAPAVRRLPEILVQAAARQPTAIMTARRDPAGEIGFSRMAGMQEEMLSLAKAAHVPAIRAMRVLEHLVGKGTPARGEMAAAALAMRAECVMLDKGPYLLDAIDALDALRDRERQPRVRADRDDEGPARHGDADGTRAPVNLSR